MKVKIFILISLFTVINLLAQTSISNTRLDKDEIICKAIISKLQEKISKDKEELGKSMSIPVSEYIYNNVSLLTKLTNMLNEKCYFQEYSRKVNYSSKNIEKEIYYLNFIISTNTDYPTPKPTFLIDDEVGEVVLKTK